MAIVVKIGGHLLARDRLNAQYVRELVRVLKECFSRRRPLIVVVGGGSTARDYIGVARNLGLSEGVCDHLGIAVSRVNALLLSSAFWNSVPPPVPDTLVEGVRQALELGITFMGGLQPGQSTTTVAALMAEAIHAELLVIATDVDGVYTSDPKVDPSARLLEEVSTSQLREMFKSVGPAGGYKLLDPYTLDILERSKIRTVILNGLQPRNILKAIEGEKIGTVVKVKI